MRISCLAPASQCGNSPTEAAHACALLTVRTHITRIQPGVLGNKDKTESTVVVDVPYSSPRDLLIQFWPARLCEERRKTVITTMDTRQHSPKETKCQSTLHSRQTKTLNTPAYSSTGHLQLQTICAHTRHIEKSQKQYIMKESIYKMYFYIISTHMQQGGYCNAYKTGIQWVGGGFFG